MRISGVTFATRRTHKTRNIILTSIILILILALTIAIISLYSGWGILHPEKTPVLSFSSNIVPEYRDINFRGSDKNILLNGWFFQTKNSDKTIILAHSYGKNRLEFGNDSINMIKDFLNKGYNVFTFDFRSSGKSGGNLSTFGLYEKDDVKAAVDYVKQQGSKHISLLGFSTGASACILAADKDIEAVIADSPYTNLHSYLSGSLNKWTNLPAFPFNLTILKCLEIITNSETKSASPLVALKNMPPCKLLIIDGKYNNMIPSSNSHTLYTAYKVIDPNLAEIWETDDSGNATSYKKYPEEYMDKVFTFLEK